MHGYLCLLILDGYNQIMESQNIGIKNVPQWNLKPNNPFFYKPHTGPPEAECLTDGILDAVSCCSLT